MANGTTPPPPPPSNSPDQKELAKRISTIVLIGTSAFGLLGIVLAIMSMIYDKGNTTNAKEILQILFSAILPLFGTWIGTVLAYYFSKENLKAANDTVQFLANTISSSKKLETTKAKDVMIPLGKLKHLDYPKNGDDTKFNLKKDFLDYIKKEGISRVILLDENNAAKYVLHKSVIEGFIAQKYFKLLGSDTGNGGDAGGGAANPPADAGGAGGGADAGAGGGAAADAGGAGAGGAANPPADAGGGAGAGAGGGATTTTLQELTFADMKKEGDDKVQAILNNGVKFVSENANLADARLLMQNFSECNDVFITKNGTANEPVLGWITDKTIAENSIV